MFPTGALRSHSECRLIRIWLLGLIDFHQALFALESLKCYEVRCGHRESNAV